MTGVLLASALAMAPALTPVDAAKVVQEVRRPGATAVLVNVWATWCTPCREEMPDLVRLHREWSGRGFRLILVSGDFDEDAEAARAFLGSVGVDFPTFLKDEGDMAFIDTLDTRWSGALPATFLYDGSGNLMEFWEGKADAATLRSKVARVLLAAPAHEKETR